MTQYGHWAPLAPLSRYRFEPLRYLVLNLEMGRRRRDFISLFGGSVAAYSPIFARAQQRGRPVIGYLNGGSSIATTLDAFRQGLSEAGYAEGHNVTMEFRWAEGEYDRLPGFAAEFVKHNVNVIAAGGGDLAARAAKAKISEAFLLRADEVIE